MTNPIPTQLTIAPRGKCWRVAVPRPVPNPPPGTPAEILCTRPELGGYLSRTDAESVAARLPASERAVVILVDSVYVSEEQS